MFHAYFYLFMLLPLSVIAALLSAWHLLLSALVSSSHKHWLHWFYFSWGLSRSLSNITADHDHEVSFHFFFLLYQCYWHWGLQCLTQAFGWEKGIFTFHGQSFNIKMFAFINIIWQLCLDPPCHLFYLTFAAFCVCQPQVYCVVSVQWSSCSHQGPKSC